MDLHWWFSSVSGWKINLIFNLFGTAGHVVRHSVHRICNSSVNSQHAKKQFALWPGDCLTQKHDWMGWSVSCQHNTSSQCTQAQRVLHRDNERSFNSFTIKWTSSWNKPQTTFNFSPTCLGLGKVESVLRSGIHSLNVLHNFAIIFVQQFRLW